MFFSNLPFEAVLLEQICGLVQQLVTDDWIHIMADDIQISFKTIFIYKYNAPGKQRTILNNTENTQC